jgi:hypothetical protein
MCSSFSAKKARTNPPTPDLTFLTALIARNTQFRAFFALPAIPSPPDASA